MCQKVETIPVELIGSEKKIGILRVVIVVL